MKQVGILTLVSVIASAAAPAAPAPSSGAAIATSKSVAQFGGCFVEAQDRAALAWSYVPKADGGTFSNVGARGATSLYFLAVSDRGRTREIRLEAASPGSAVDSRVARAVNQCA
jgi:hypothetical protein